MLLQERGDDFHISRQPPLESGLPGGAGVNGDERFRSLHNTCNGGLGILLFGLWHTEVDMFDIRLDTESSEEVEVLLDNGPIGEQPDSDVIGEARTCVVETHAERGAKRIREKAVLQHTLASCRIDDEVEVPVTECTNQLQFGLECMMVRGGVIAQRLADDIGMGQQIEDGCVKRGEGEQFGLGACSVHRFEQRKDAQDVADAACLENEDAVEIFEAGGRGRFSDHGRAKPRRGF